MVVLIHQSRVPLRYPRFSVSLEGVSIKTFRRATSEMPNITGYQIGMETPILRLSKIKVEGRDKDNHSPQGPQPAYRCSVSAMDMDLTIDGDVRATSMETTVRNEKSVSDISVRPKATRGRPGRPRKSQPRAITITSGPEIVAVDDKFSVTDSSVASGSQKLDNSSSTFDHPMGTRNFLKKRKSEVINSESALIEYKSSGNKSSFDSFGTQHRTSMQSESSTCQKLAGQPTRFNAYLALPDDPVRARQWSAKDWDVTLLHLLPKCLMSLKIHEPTTIIVMEGCIEIKNDSFISNCTVLESKTKPLEIDAGRNIQIGNVGSGVATFQTITAMKSIILPEDHEQPMRYNAYKARPDDPVSAQQLVSEKDVRISWIHLHPKCYLPFKIHDPTTIVLIKGRINIIKDLAVSHSMLLNSSMESIEIETGNLIHVANFGHEIAKFQVVEFLK
ncbi:uncharacterized protein LOC124204583 isoform X2 [Daphnia pulex]|uniref:uncharacterized protein LOC124204583 isoform X2 n=2 Tax=Daphnia pulex TaxID=6669 RepID=UPI001EDF3328|nr:uncharacterized protein LOC124204583 isoform X2 [Daphnia pulex]